VDALRARIAALRLADMPPGLLDGIASPKDRIVCVCPIDESAPKGRLILPQVQLIRDCLDRHIAASVCQPEELAGELSHSGGGNVLVVTDSQAFGKVKEILAALARGSMRLTSFSILFARQKGDLDEFTAGLKAIGNLKDGDTVLVAEGCTHHRQCNDIGTVKIPKAVERLSGRKLSFAFASGNTFDLPDGSAHAKPALVVHCGGCMLTRREVLRRIAAAKSAGVPIVNYGILLAAASGVDIPVCNFTEKMR
jgi:[FeFe] hydrogenase H-cluster maturation GTPase HydF